MSKITAGCPCSTCKAQLKDFFREMTIRGLDKLIEMDLSEDDEVDRYLDMWNGIDITTREYRNQEKREKELMHS